MFAVDSLNAWRCLSISQEPLILVATASLPLRAEDVSQAVNAGHHVLICGNRYASPSAPQLRLPRQDVCSIVSELRSCGFDDSTARSIGLSCCGSSSVLKRRLRRFPESEFPEWSKDEHRVSLAPFALVGGWADVDSDGTRPFGADPPLDLECLQDVMEIERESLEANVARWSQSDEPLFLRFRDCVVIASREDAWYLLGSSVAPQMLRRFEQLASLVLDEDHPALDLEAEERWMANVYGKTHTLSDELRDGLIETLVLMKVYPNPGDCPRRDFEGAVDRILNDVLPCGASWKRWATLDRHLPLLAEADPDFVLRRMDEDLRSDAPQIPRLFQSGGHGPLSSPLHCGLLWALEVLAWSRVHLGLATDILARLVEIENALPDNMGNSPSNTLENIYLLPSPHTIASMEDRMAELSRLNLHHPEVGWALLIKLLPGGGPSCYSGTEMPRWRNWAAGWSRELVHDEIPGYAERIAALVLEIAGNSPERWAQALDYLLGVNYTIAGRAIERMSRVVANCDDASNRSLLWKAIGNTIDRWRGRPYRNRVLPKDLLERLLAIRDQVRPDDPVVLNEWLFEMYPDLPGVDISEDYDLYQSTLAPRRVSALREIASAQGWKGIVELVEAVPGKGEIGWICAKHSLLSPEEICLCSLVESDSSDLQSFGDAYVAGSFAKSDFEFLDGLQLDSRPPKQAALILCSTPFTKRTWEWIDLHLSAEARDEYWRRCFGVLRGKDPHELAFAAERLIQVHRPFVAAEIIKMAMTETKVDGELVYSVLEAGLTVQQDPEEFRNGDLHATQQLIKYLQEHSTDQLLRLGKIEWGYLSILGRGDSTIEPATLMQQLQADPELFVDLLKVVYRGANEDACDYPTDERLLCLAQNARRLLDTFSKIPGRGTDGTIDEERLSRWIEQVRSSARNVDRIRVADMQIGHLLARVPRTEDADWPPSPICRAMEACESDGMLEGFTNGLANGRGMTSRRLTAGGDPERKLAIDYREVANRKRSEFPRLANALDGLAKYYDRLAEREDEDAERYRLNR